MIKKSLRLSLILSVVMLSALIVGICTAGQVMAMGDPPSTCVNRYDATITSMKIIQGDQIYKPIIHPGTKFVSYVQVGYTIRLTLHSASTSVDGNTNTGSVWYGSTAYGFASDHCVDGVGPNQDVTIKLHNVFMGQATSGTRQSVEWYSWSDGGVLQGATYTVKWH